MATIIAVDLSKLEKLAEVFEAIALLVGRCKATVILPVPHPCPDEVIRDLYNLFPGGTVYIRRSVLKSRSPFKATGQSLTCDTLVFEPDSAGHTLEVGNAR